MFEFEDNDFTLMESFSLAAGADGSADFDDVVLARGTYLGDGVWVVDTSERGEETEQAQSPVSES